MTRLLTIGLLLLATIISARAQMAVSHPPATPTKPNTEMVTPEAGGKPVARVNVTVLTDRDLLREMYAIFPYARQHNNGFPKAMEADIRAGALKMIVFEELVYQEALRRQLVVPPAKLERAVRDFKKQFSSPEEFNEFLKAECRGSQKVMRARITRSLLIDQLLTSEVSNRAVISLVQARAYAIQTISVLPKPNATSAQQKELRAKAEEALQQAKTTKDYEEFGVLAEKISEDDYRVMMGDRRAVDRAKLPPEVLKAAEALQPGQVSGLIPLEQGYTIIRLNAHIPAGLEKFEAVKDAIRKQLNKQKTEQLRSALNQRLRAHAKVEVL